MKKFLLLSILMFALVLTGFAQTTVTPYVTGRVGATANLGYTNPDLSVGGGLNLENKTGIADVTATFSPTDKLGHEGNTVDFVASAYYKVPQNAFGTRIPKNFLLGGGVKYSTLFTSYFDKTATRPFAGIGYQFDKATVYTNYVFSGIDPVYKLHGFNGIVQIPVNKKYTVGFDFGLYRFLDTPHSGKLTAATTGVSLKYNF